MGHPEKKNRNRFLGDWGQAELGTGEIRLVVGRGGRDYEERTGIRGHLGE